METLRIAFFCWESLHSVRVGGLAAAATNLAENVAKKFEVHYYTPGLPGQEKEAEINGVHYHRCYPSGGNIVEYCRNMSLQMVDDFKKESRNGSFDVLHFHDWHIADALDQLRDETTLLTFHSTEFGRSGNTFGDWWEFREISAKEKYAGLISKKVTTVSQTLKNEVKRLYGIPEWKINVVRNGIHPEAYYMDVDEEKVKAEYGIPADAPLILFTGRLTYQKGPDLLLDAIPDVLKNRSDSRFVFVGDGNMHGQLRDRTLATRDTIRFLGYLPDEEFVRLLNACDICAIPSRNEPFGLVLLEAWSAEKSVVATDVGGLSENIENYVDGVKVPVNPDGIARGINHVIDDTMQLRDMGKNGKRKIEDEFRWHVIAKKMMREYSAVLN